jgi:hypothetical protein
MMSISRLGQSDLGPPRSIVIIPSQPEEKLSNAPPIPVSSHDLEYRFRLQAYLVILFLTVSENAIIDNGNQTLHISLLVVDMPVLSAANSFTEIVALPFPAKTHLCDRDCYEAEEEEKKSDLH